MFSCTFILSWKKYTVYKLEPEWLQFCSKILRKNIFYLKNIDISILYTFFII